METQLKILVVDDEEGMRKGIERVLRALAVEHPDLRQSAGFAVELAASGEEALEAIARQVPDLLLLDYKLPGISGLEVQQELARRGLAVLTVMISAYSSLQTVIAATKQGAYDFLVKPFTPEELRATLRKATRHLLLQRQALRLEQERRQVRFEFIRVLGHELKSPLAAVEGFLQLMERRTLGPELAAYQSLVRRSAARIDGMRKLIEDLLDLTRIESGNKERHLEEVDLCQVIAAAAETFADTAAQRRVAIHLELPPSLVLRADRGELEMILNNLLSNAVKYNREGGAVTAKARDRGSAVELEVADTGIGMSQAEVARLFREFSRIRNERTAAIPGSGLGLSIVEKLAALYGGRVRVESQPGVGSTFTVVLPSPPGPLSQGERG
jgi:signal transduction histidine kinase